MLEAVDLLLESRADVDVDEREDELFELALLSYDLGELALAQRTWTNLVEILSSRLPDDDAELLAARHELARTLLALGDVAGALALQESVVAGRRRTCPEGSIDLIKAEQNLAAILLKQGRLEESGGLLEHLLAVGERTFADDDIELLRTRANLAGLRFLRGDLPAARALFEKVVLTGERTLPADARELLVARLNLASVLQRQQDYAGARALQEEVVAQLEHTLPGDHPDLNLARINLSNSLVALGEYAQTRPVLEQVLASMERTLPADHPDLQVARGSLAAVLIKLGQSKRARLLREQVLAVCEQALPEQHVDLQTARLELALSLQDDGELEGARALQERVIATLERAYPDDHPTLQIARSNLAGTLWLEGDLAAARALHEGVLTRLERTLPEDHPSVIAARANLATTLMALGDLEGALLLNQSTLANCERSLPDDHPTLFLVRLNLAAVLQMRGDFAAARALCERALAHHAQPQRDDDPAVHLARLNHASVMWRMGDMVQALELQEKVLAALDPALPDDHYVVRIARNNSAWLYIAAGDPARAAEILAQVLRASWSLLDAAAARPERERGEMASSMEAYVSALLAMLPLLGEHGSALQGEVFELVETIRARSTIDGAFADTDPELMLLRERARSLRAELNDRVAATLNGQRPSELQGEIADLAHERDRVESEVARVIADRGGLPLRVRLDELMASLPRGACAVGFRRYRQLELSVDRGRIEGEQDYLMAWLVQPERKLTRVDLGPLAPIRDAVVEWRAAIGSALLSRAAGIAEPRVGTGAPEAVGRLRALVLDPILAAATEASELEVCLDDVLHLVPLDALPFGDRPLGELLTVHVEPSFARWVRVRPPVEPSGALLALGDVDFSAAPVEEASTSALAAAPPVARTLGSFLGSSLENGWPALAGTRDEVLGIAGSYRAAFGREPALLQGSHANKAALRQQAPLARFLHLATHGYFAPDSVRSSGEARSDSSALWTPMSASETVVGFAPMTLCGLVLAGANRGADMRGRVAGIVTAEELASLDLSKCELAVLSACDTSVGVQRSGQSIFSLQTALHAAGARSVITSLWKVPDEATKVLMLDFYRRLWVEKKPKHQALWEAKMMLRDAQDEGGQPLYSTHDWAAWVLTGDPL